MAELVRVVRTPEQKSANGIAVTPSCAASGSVKAKDGAVRLRRRASVSAVPLNDAGADGQPPSPCPALWWNRTSKSSSRSGSMPLPVSAISTSTLPSALLVLMVMVQERSFTSAIASTAFITRVEQHLLDRCRQ